MECIGLVAKAVGKEDMQPFMPDFMHAAFQVCCLTSLNKLANEHLRQVWPSTCRVGQHATPALASASTSLRLCHVDFAAIQAQLIWMQAREPLALMQGDE